VTAEGIVNDNAWHFAIAAASEKDSESVVKGENSKWKIVNNQLQISFFCLRLRPSYALASP